MDLDEKQNTKKYEFEKEKWNWELELKEKKFQMDLTISALSSRRPIEELEWILTLINTQPSIPSPSVPYSANGYSDAPSTSDNEKGKYNEINGKDLVDVPPMLFWPYDPRNPVDMVINSAHLSHSQNPGYQASIGTIGCQPSQEAFVSEEMDTTVTNAQMQKWITVVC